MFRESSKLDGEVLKINSSSHSIMNSELLLKNLFEHEVSEISWIISNRYIGWNTLINLVELNFQSINVSGETFLVTGIVTLKRPVTL